MRKVEFLTMRVFGEVMMMRIIIEGNLNSSKNICI
jgi:hypothetical protein